ncbi:uncharacterized protein LOC132166730 [Corylus avellana]|uniref:uncharacterized protein LOC132166730 n=1 Tax=Corylus avellana TaxID=13451 RepID=UPI00286B1060|nr:uncharacterized protein LOC132166730 [Corylus avellana]
MNLKVLKAKQTLQLAFLLGVCFWLLYQIEHSHSKGKGYGGSIQGKLNDQHGFIVLGRKWDAGWSSGDDMNLVGEGKRKEDGGVGDDELDGNADEQFGKYMVFINNEENNSDDSWGNLKKQAKEDLERQIKEPEKNKEMISDDTLKQDQDVEAGSLNRENEEDKNIVESKEEIAEQPSGVANNVGVVGRSEMLDGVMIQGFHDENGVPQDGNNPLDSTLTDHHSRDDHDGNFLNQETSLNSSNYSRFSETFSRDDADTKE